jgi:hypothetical protein
VELDEAVISFRPFVSSLCGSGGLRYHLILNVTLEMLEFGLPPTISGRKGRHRIDTSLPSLEDIREWNLAAQISRASYGCGPRSVARSYLSSFPSAEAAYGK